MPAPPSPGPARAAPLRSSVATGKARTVAAAQTHTVQRFAIPGGAGTVCSAGDVMEGQPVELTAADGRITGPSGWRRALLGLLVGAVIGAVIGLVLPRDDGPRRPTRSA